MASIQTTLRRSAIFLLLVALAALVAAWLALRASLPRADGLRSGSGVAAAVRVERDALGTVTIRAGSRPDAAWALGYVHAQERWFGMDL
uniref:penicillin acylase family protein n=1 Tax=Dokdonella sp. TaxID=2291710 RepID=UPI0027B945B6